MRGFEVRDAQCGVQSGSDVEKTTRNSIGNGVVRARDRKDAEQSGLWKEKMDSKEQQVAI
jgi:hypothetical protein